MHNVSGGRLLPATWNTPGFIVVWRRDIPNANEQSLCVHNTTRASLTCIVGQSSVVHVKEEPSLLPRLHPSPSFGQEACAAARRQPQVRAGGHPVAQRLHMGPEVEVGRQEKRLPPLLKICSMWCLNVTEKSHFLFSGKWWFQLFQTRPWVTRQWYWTCVSDIA